jgi:hypothetical protein
MTSVEEVKERVHNYIERLDDSFLHVVHSMLDTYLKQRAELDGTIIGYTVEGEAKRAGDIKIIYDASVDAAVQDHEYTSIEELKEKSRQ